MLIKSRIKESIRALFSQNYLLPVSVDNVFKMAGKNAVKNFVQIGSNDGKKNDPIHSLILKNNWKGILVEPDTINYKKLIESYSSNRGLIFENLGIGPENGEMTFYKLSNITTNDPDWYDQVGSFDKKTFIKNIEVVPGLIERLSVETLQVITFEELLEKNGFSTVDLLHTDTEGYDYKILKSINFSKYNIKIVFFETDWMTQYELREIILFLRNFNYSIFRHGIDHVAIKKK